MTRISILESLCYTDVVTSINDEALILVRNTYGNSKSKVLNSISKFDIFGKRLSKARAYRSGSINLHLLGNAESRLDTCLESKPLNRIELSQDGDVDVVELVGKLTLKVKDANTQTQIRDINFDFILTLYTLL